MPGDEILQAVLDNAKVAQSELKSAMPFADVCIVVGLPDGQSVYCSSCEMQKFLGWLSTTVLQCREKMKPMPAPTHENSGSIN